jgi:hypothetical protein
MSRAAKLTLAGSSLFALGTIVFVHYAQQAEKAVCSLFFQSLILPDASSCYLHAKTSKIGVCERKS